MVEKCEKIFKLKTLKRKTTAEGESFLLVDQIESVYSKATKHFFFPPPPSHIPFNFVISAHFIIQQIKKGKLCWKNEEYIQFRDVAVKHRGFYEMLQASLSSNGINLEHKALPRKNFSSFYFTRLLREVELMRRLQEICC